MGFSEASTFLGGGDTRPQRQQTAPPAPTSSAGVKFGDLAELRRQAAQETNGGTHPDNDTVVLRVKGTFMEAVNVEDLMAPSPLPVRRSWSDGDLRQLREVMEGMCRLDEEF